MPKRRRVEGAAVDGTGHKPVTRGASQPQQSKEAADAPSTQAQRGAADQQNKKHRRGKQPESDKSNGKTKQNNDDAATLQPKGKARQKVLGAACIALMSNAVARNSYFHAVYRLTKQQT